MFILLVAITQEQDPYFTHASASCSVNQVQLEAELYQTIISERLIPPFYFK